MTWIHNIHNKTVEDGQWYDDIHACIQHTMYTVHRAHRQILYAGCIHKEITSAHYYHSKQLIELNVSQQKEHPISHNPQ